MSEFHGTWDRGSGIIEVACVPHDSQNSRTHRRRNVADKAQEQDARGCSAPRVFQSEVGFNRTLSIVEVTPWSFHLHLGDMGDGFLCDSRRITVAAVRNGYKLAPSPDNGLPHGVGRQAHKSAAEHRLGYQTALSDPFICNGRKDKRRPRS